MLTYLLILQIKQSGTKRAYEAFQLVIELINQSTMASSQRPDLNTYFQTIREAEEVRLTLTLVAYLMLIIHALKKY
ncbi:MAG: hypothetical protein CMF49_01900 [Legionellales bacterium]|nr:hypothetical protein [Legionellales bacterium]|tara:strand:+ start:51 stop:278 length:228 start_codon:yes stop_codon:yes gene_type:complete